MLGRCSKGLVLTGLVFAALLVPTTPAVATSFFSDGFESGNLLAWTSTVGGFAAVQDAGFAFGGSWYGRATSAGPSTYAQKTFASAQSEIYTQTAVNVISTPSGFSGLTLLRLMTASGAAIVSLKLDKTLHLTIKNQLSGSQVTSATTLASGAWHVLQLHARVSGSLSSLVEVWLDGAQVTDLTSSASLGTVAFGGLLLGNLGTTGGFTVGFDEVVADTAFIGGTPPGTPTNLHTTSVTSSRVSLAWDPVSGAAGYGVYRGGTKLFDVTSASFEDTTVQPSTQYTYTVDAFAGTLRSAPTPGLDVTTPDPTPPATPTNLHTTSVTSSRVSLAWDPVSGAAGYGVYRGGTKLFDVTSASFDDTTVQPSTLYTYTVDAFAGTLRSAPSPGLDVTTPAQAGSIVVRAAGDIACDPADPNFNGGAGTATKCQQMATSNLLSGADNVLIPGDTQYDCDGAAAFPQSFGPSWGRFKSVTWAAVGDNAYNTPTQSPNGTGCTTNRDAAGYFGYFGNRGGSVTATPLPGVSQSTIPGVYSFNLPEGCTPGLGGTCTWHIVALNSNCDLIGTCSAGSPIDTWLQQDLANNTWAGCTLAFEHHPRFTSKANGGGPQVNGKMLQLWKDYVSGGVDVVLNGHTHFYERFAPQDANGNAMATGAAEFILGMGGRGEGAIAPPSQRLPNSQAGQSGTFGVLQMTLQDGSYGWNFLPIAGGSFADTGSAACT
jgi:chitodextrinase